MKKINYLICFVDKSINFCVVILFIVALFFSGYAIYDTYATYESAKLPDFIKKYQPDEENSLEIDQIKEEINNDIVGWITIHDTSINYPIVQGKDNREYLNMNYQREHSLPGSIFMDYRNDKKFLDDYSILYGHNLINNTMFGGLIKFEKKDYFDKHLSGMLYTGDHTYRIEVLSFAVLDAYSDVYNIILNANSNNKIIYQEIMKYSKVKSDVSLEDGDKLLLLSTCRANQEEERSVLLTKIVLMN